jgi:hypothetical protein
LIVVLVPQKGVNNGFVEALLVPAALLVRAPRDAGQGLVHTPASEDSQLYFGESFTRGIHSCLVVRGAFALLRKSTQHRLTLGAVRRVLDGVEAVRVDNVFKSTTRDNTSSNTS